MPARTAWQGLLLSSERRTVAAAIVLTKTLLILRGGGDWMPGWRMLVPITPLVFYVVFSFFFVATTEGETDRRPAGIPAIALATVLFLGGYASVPRFPNWDGLSNEGGLLKKLPQAHLDIGRILRDSFAGPSEEVAIGEAGLVPFEALDVRFLDLLAINDRELASKPRAMHDKVRFEDVVRRRPAAVLFAHLHVRPPYGPYAYGRELLGDKRFFLAYRRLDLGERLTLLGWALYLRKDLLAAHPKLPLAQHDSLASTSAVGNGS